MLPEGPGQAPRPRGLPVLAVMLFFASLAGGMRAPLVPLKTQDLGAGPSEVGVVVSLFMLAAAILSMPLGATSDRLGKRLVLFAGLTGSMLASFLFAWAPSPGWMGAVMLIAGAAATASLTSSLGLYTSYAAPGAMGRGFARVTAGMILGFAVGPYLGGLLAERFSYFTAFFTAGVIFLLVLALGLRLLPGEQPPAAGDEARHPAGGARAIFSRPGLRGCFVAAFGGAFITGMFMAFFPLYVKGLGMSSAVVGLLFSLRSVANGLSRLPAGWSLDRFHRPAAMVFLGLLALAAINEAFVLTRNTFALAAVSLAFGMATALTFTSLGTTVARKAPPQTKGLAMGAYVTCIYSGALASNFLMGHALEAWGYVAGFGLASVVGLAVGMVGVRLLAGARRAA